MSCQLIGRSGSGASVKNWAAWVARSTAFQPIGSGGRQADPERLAELIAKWAVVWQNPYVVIDTHPGSGRAGRGALAVADLVVVPTLLRTKELNALAGAVVEYHDFPLLVVPNMVPPVPPAKELQRLTSIVRGAKVPVGPPVRFHPWWTRRQIPSAISAYPDDAVPATVYEAWHQLQRLTQEVQRHVG